MSCKAAIYVVSNTPASVLAGGVVPMGAENRAWRQRTGRLSQYLSREADRVSRIFCGLELRLK